MANLCSRIVLEQQRRRADIKLSKYTNVYIDFDKPAIGTYPGYVLGLYAIQECYETSEALFACELANGQCVYRPIDSVVFTRAYEAMADEEYEQYVQEKWEEGKNAKNSD